MPKQQPLRKSISELVPELSNPDRFSRFNAVRDLVNSGPVAAEAWPAILALRDDPCHLVRIEVLRGTYLLSVLADEAVPLLTHFLRDENSIVRSYAKWALEEKYGQSVRSRAEHENSGPKSWSQ